MWFKDFVRGEGEEKRGGGRRGRGDNEAEEKVWLVNLIFNIGTRIISRTLYRGNI